MASWEGWVRRVVVGRKNGIRAAIRRELNVGTWLDQEQEHIVPDEPERAPDPRWLRVGTVEELPSEGELVEAFADGRAVVLVRIDDTVHAIDSTCPHAGGPLGEGELYGTQLTCPWHGWAFDVVTGASSVDAASCVETFDVRIEGNDVFVAPRAGS